MLTTSSALISGFPYIPWFVFWVTTSYGSAPRIYVPLLPEILPSSPCPHRWDSGTYHWSPYSLVLPLVPSVLSPPHQKLLESWLYLPCTSHIVDIPLLAIPVCWPWPNPGEVSLPESISFSSSVCPKLPTWNPLLSIILASSFFSSLKWQVWINYSVITYS